MKKIALLFVLVMFISSSFAQNKGVRYQGEVQLGYGIGVGKLGLDGFHLRMINGVRINEYFSTGLGVGLNIYIENGESATAIPIFANFKGHLPTSGIIEPFISLDAGYAIGVSELDGLGGLLISPEIGIGVKTSQKTAMNLSVGYISQSFGTGGVNVNTNSIAIKLGFRF